MAHVKKKNQHLQTSLKDYFTLSYKVKRGLMVLFVIMIAEIIVLAWLHYVPATAPVVDYSAFKKEIDAFYADAEKKKKSHSEKNVFRSADEKEFKESDPAELYHFNPNQLPDKDWRRLGFSEKQIRSIKNYESKGGSFRSKADVKKMYAISDAEFVRIEPFIDLPEEKKTETIPFKKNPKPFLTVDIGTADTVEFSTLPMVGDYLAYKIYNFYT